jgi:putative membrane protein
MYEVVRGLHILAVIAWMAGLLYLPRLFIYHIKHKDTAVVTDVFKVMERNLLRIIMNPAMIAAWLFGSILIYIDIHDRWGLRFLWQPWFIVKIVGIVGVTGYHHFLSVRFKKLMRDEDIGSESLWRKLNEIPFVLAIIMVLAVTIEFFTV